MYVIVESIKEGDYNMCKAVKEIEAKAEEKGFKQGVEQGIEQGIEQERISAVRNLMKSLKLSAEQAMDSLGIPKSEYKKYLTML